MTGRHDVVIVGGGIAGAGLAVTLARAGIDVLVLEKTVEFDDINRGEMMLVWGVRIAKDLDLFDTLAYAGAHTVSEKVFWSESIPEPPQVQPLDGLMPGVEGALNIAHPKAREALLSEARRCGARIARGITVESIVTGAKPALSWRDAEGTERTTACRLIIGADGRRSVIRRLAGIDLERYPETHVATGMLVRSDGIPTGRNTIAAEDGWLMLTFPQGDGHARVYHCFASTDRHRYAGPGSVERFLANSALRCLPDPEAWSGARQAGPIGTFPCADSEADPVGDGVVLVGDAAGYNNYQIGQGLALAMADVRSLAQVLTSGRSWDTDALHPYAEARRERLGRVRHLARFIMLRVDGFTPGSPRREVAFDLELDEVLAATGPGFDTGFAGLDITAEQLATAVDAFERRLDEAVAAAAA